MNLQLVKLHTAYDKLQKTHGDPNLMPIYGAGCLNKPKVMLVFMNPTGKNISSAVNWQGIRAPWLGTKNIWRLISEVGLLSSKSLNKISTIKPWEWGPAISLRLYEELAVNKCFITNLAKCTQLDARPLRDSVFKNYLRYLYEEILTIMPERIITFGNQVSTIVMNKKICVGDYKNNEHETLAINNSHHKIFPTFYPVGQGIGNMPKAIARIRLILRNHR